MIKAIIFDLDNTLYDENLYFLKVFKKFSDQHGHDFTLFNEIFTDTFRLKSKDIFGDLLTRLNCNNQSNQNELFEIYKTINCDIELYNEASKILEYLDKKKIKKAIITNGTIDAQKNKVKLLNLHKYVDKIIYARELGKDYEKPNAMPFYEAIKALNIQKDEAIYVGDHPNTDIEGANKAGIKALRFLNGYASGINYSHNDNIKSLIEIKKYI